jgi:hypothetical protein
MGVWPCCFRDEIDCATQRRVKGWSHELTGLSFLLGLRKERKGFELVMANRNAMPGHQD